mmetsp:Transcript_26874/g.55815  ORF Transcript_26874/g.55815 Transcript_26874/m.55815 type:complete len:202 (-) Transcript_26874:59-664(-)
MVDTFPESMPRIFAVEGLYILARWQGVQLLSAIHFHPQIVLSACRKICHTAALLTVITQGTLLRLQISGTIAPSLQREYVSIVRGRFLATLATFHESTASPSTGPRPAQRTSLPRTTATTASSVPKSMLAGSASPRAPGRASSACDPPRPHRAGAEMRASGSAGVFSSSAAAASGRAGTGLAAAELHSIARACDTLATLLH